MSTNYNKLLILLATAALAAIPQLVAQADAFGLTPVIANWLSLSVAVIGAVLHVAVPNAYQPTVPAGHAVVPLADATTLRNATFVRAANVLLLLLLVPLFAGPAFAMADEPVMVTAHFTVLGWLILAALDFAVFPIVVAYLWRARRWQRVRERALERVRWSARFA